MCIREGLHSCTAMVGLVRVLAALSASCGAANRLDAWARAHPLQTTAAAATLRGAVGDLAAQKLELARSGDGDASLDRRRLVLYTSFTNLVAAVYDRPIYTGLFPRWFPSVVDGRRAWGNVARAALVDNLVCSPLLYFPLFYVFKDVVVERSRGLGGALRHYARELPAQLPVCWSFWIPLTATSQAFVPVHLRIPYISLAACAWVGILSTATAKLDRAASRSC